MSMAGLPPVLLATSLSHGAIQDPDKAAGITDGGMGAVVRGGWYDRSVKPCFLPEGTPYANLNNCAFDGDFRFTWQCGYVGKLAVKPGGGTVKESPRGCGPYSICAMPAGEVWWRSLAGSFIARIDRRNGDSVIVEPPTKDQDARCVWSDSRGRIWVSKWNGGNLSMHEGISKLTVISIWLSGVVVLELMPPGLLNYDSWLL